MIRPGVPEDLSTLRALQERALESPVPELLELGARGAGATLLVSTETGDAVGYALAVADEAGDPPQAEGPDGDRAGGDPTGGPPSAIAYLAEVAVDPAFRREGRATALVEGLADRLDVERLQLAVREDDATARSFYRATGFDPVRRLPGHYDDGEAAADGLLLARPV